MRDFSPLKLPRMPPRESPTGQAAGGCERGRAAGRLIPLEPADGTLEREERAHTADLLAWGLCCFSAEASPRSRAARGGLDLAALLGVGLGHDGGWSLDRLAAAAADGWWRLSAVAVALG